MVGGKESETTKIIINAIETKFTKGPDPLIQVTSGKFPPATLAEEENTLRDDVIDIEEQNGIWDYRVEGRI
jgi:hypothetical protein